MISKDGFHGWLGCNLGIRVKTSVNINYRDYDESACVNRSGSFCLRRVMFGGQLGMGYKRFGLLGKYSFTSLFDKDKQVAFNALNPLSVALYIDLF